MRIVKKYSNRRLYDTEESRYITLDELAGLGAAPYAQPTNASLRALAWRPGCEEGVAVGGASSLAGTTAFVAAFRVMGGRRCP